MRTKEENTTALPGLWATLAAGFDVVTGHLWLVMIPILLDVFYWVGPQLRSSELWLSLASLIRDAGVMVEMSEQLTNVAGQTNLFTILSVPFLGVPGLMAGIVMPEVTPVNPVAIEIRGAASWFLLFVAVSFAGLMISAVFHAFLARSVCNDDSEGCQFTTVPGQPVWYALFVRLPRYCLRMLGLAILLFLIVMSLYMPLVLVATVVTLISPTVGSLIMLSGLMMIIWVLFYLSFGLHGIFLREQSVFVALLDSMRLVRRNWMPAFTLLLLVLAVRNLLSWLFHLVDSGTWFTLVNIVGFAFVNTSLIAATFIFYRDRVKLQKQGFLNE